MKSVPVFSTFLNLTFFRIFFFKRKILISVFNDAVRRRRWRRHKTTLNKFFRDDKNDKNDENDKNEKKVIFDLSNRHFIERESRETNLSFNTSIYFRPKKWKTVKNWKMCLCVGVSVSIKNSVFFSRCPNCP